MYPGSATSPRPIDRYGSIHAHGLQSAEQIVPSCLIPAAVRLYSSVSNRTWLELELFDRRVGESYCRGHSDMLDRGARNPVTLWVISRVAAHPVSGRERIAK